MFKLRIDHKQILTKPMLVMLLGVAALFGSLFAWKAIHSYLVVRQGRLMLQPEIPVSTTKVTLSSWQPVLKAVGTLRAVQGITVTTETPGLVEKIYFLPGTYAKKGERLVQLNADTERSQLQAMEAQVELAKITYQRDVLQYKAHGVSKQTVEGDFWKLKNIQAQAQGAKLAVQKKSIYAPFSGKLGMSQISLGQYIKPGDNITTLQTFNPIYVDFYLPQQVLRYLKQEQRVVVTTDVFLQQQFVGKIATIEPQIDVKTSSLAVEAEIMNPHASLFPGMYVSIEIQAQKPKRYLTLPQSALSFDSYGEFVFLVKTKDVKSKLPQFFVEQTYVTTGAMRENEVAILKGLKVGDIVVTGGQLKLNNGSVIKIDNVAVPAVKG